MNETAIVAQASAAYRSLLGVRSEAEWRKITLASIRKELAPSLPVRLSTVARHFGIEPIPRFDAHVEGELAYDSHRCLFVIHLNPQCEPSNRRKMTGTSVALARARFTYAHEFCHRFCYVNRGTDWTRVMEEVAKCAGSAAESAVIHRALHRMEERMCNRLAGELLIPSEHVGAVIGPRVAKGRVAGDIEVCRVLADVAATFAVSFECASVRVSQMVRDRDLQWCDGLVVLLLDHDFDRHAKTCRDLHRMLMRVKCAVGFVPGMKYCVGCPVSSLGADFEAAVHECTLLPPGAEQEFCAPLAPSNGGNQRGTGSLRLRGRARRLSLSPTSRGARVLVWGTV